MMMIPRRNDFDLWSDMFREPFFIEHEAKMMKTDIKEKDVVGVFEVREVKRI